MRTGIVSMLLYALAGAAFAPLCYSQPDEDESLKRVIDASKATVLQFADALEKGIKTPKDLAEEAPLLAKKHKLRQTHMLLGPKSRGGIGIGELVKEGHKDSLESLLRGYAYRPPTKAEITKHERELLQAAQITMVIAQITPYWGPARPVDKYRTPALWQSLSEDMKNGSSELAAGVKANDEKAVTSAAKKLTMTCAGCHRRIHDEK
jgi:hypothetical protein